jgi:Na+-driven multidrug efflux pump
MVPILVFAEQVVAFFNENTLVIEYGSMLLRYITPFYLLCCFNQIYSGALRGSGNSRAPMIFMLTSFVAFRQVYLFIMSRICNEIIPIAMSYPAGWLLCATLTTIYYHRAKLGSNRLVEEPENKEK